jgi:hypothetical protein
MRRNVVALLAALLLALLLVGAQAQLRAPFEPSVGELLAVDLQAAARHRVLPWVALLCAAIAVAAAGWTERGRRAGPFAGFVAVVAAAGLPLLLQGIGLDVATAVAAGLGLGLLSVVLLPMLKERGLVSLCLGGAVAALPHLLSHRQCVQAAHSATTPAAVTAVLFGAAEAALLLDEELDERTAAAIAQRLLPPFAPAPTALLAAAPGSAAAALLRRMPTPLFALDGGRCQLVPTRPDLVPLRADALQAHWQGAGQPPTVACAEAALGEVHLLSPVGALSGRLDADGRAEFTPADAVRFGRLVSALPSGARVRVLVIPPERADGLLWTDLSR